MIGPRTSLWQRVIPQCGLCSQIPRPLEVGRVNTPMVLVAVPGHWGPQSPYLQPQSCQQPLHLPCMAVWGRAHALS